jgi:hypothetical protein
MSNLTLTMVHHRGEPLALGRNVAVKLLLEKSAGSKPLSNAGIWSLARVLWSKPSLAQRES